MKLITLNIWGGHIKEPLLKFMAANQDIDIFCLQEVYHQAPNKVSTEDRELSLNIFSEIQEQLPQHHGYFSGVVQNIYGLAMFIRKEITVIKEDRIKIHDNPNYPGVGPTHSRYLQSISCLCNNQMFSIINVHGLWNGMGKTDSPERIIQSQNIKRYVDSITHPKILCGDFNLRPDTESMMIIEEGLTNLIQTHGVTSTRTSLYSKEEKFADYIFTSPEIKVNQFEVLTDEVSDHSPLLLDFD